MSTMNWNLPACAKGDFFAEALMDEYNSGQSVQNELAILIEGLATGRDYAETLRVIAGSIEVDPMGYGFGSKVKKIAGQIRRFYG